MGIDGVDVDIDNVDNVEDKSRTSEYCICCICEKPEVLVLPEYLKACDSNIVEDVSSPFIGSRSLQLVLNQKNFDEYVNTLDNANLKKVK